MKSWVIAVIFGAALIGLATAESCAAGVDDLAMEAVRSKLRDPDTAKFEGVVATPNGVCGRVNAKNGYGGYAGAIPFSVKLSDGKPGGCVPG